MKKHIKSIAIGLLLAALLIAAIGGAAFAAGGRGRSCNNCNFADANGDGICDNLGTGVCAGSAAGTNCGRNCNFADADGDGVCDNLGTGACAGAGYSAGHHGCRGGCRR